MTPKCTGQIHLKLSNQKRHAVHCEQGQYKVSLMAYTQSVSWHILNQSHGIYSIGPMAYTQSISWHILNQSHGIYSISLMAYTLVVSWHILNQSHGIYSIMALHPITETIHKWIYSNTLWRFKERGPSSSFMAYTQSVSWHILNHGTTPNYRDYS